MGLQIVGVGLRANDGTGDPARTGIQKINMNFVELWSYLSGVEGSKALPVAIPILRGGTGATTAEGARKALGIGAAATKSIGTNEGDLFTVGTFGLGTDLSPTVLIADEVKPSAYKSGQCGWLNSYNVTAVTLATRDSKVKAQQGIKNVSGTPEVVYRGSAADVFGKWYTAFGESNSTVTVNGNIKYALNSLKLKHTSCESQHGKAFTMTNPAVGSYTVQNATLDNSNWTIEVPMDYKGNVQFEVVITQLGTALDVKVTKDGKPYAIPTNAWIDIHIK